MAQVLVVVALAVVLEARAIMKGWDASVPGWWRFIQGTIWAVPLIAIALILPKTLRATRPDALVSASLDTWCENLLGVSLGLVVLGPAVEVLRRASARPLAVLLTLGVRRRWQLHRLERQMRGHRKSIVKLLKSASQMEAENAQDRAQVDAFRAQVEQILASDLSPEEQQAARAYLADLDEWITKNNVWLAESPVREGPGNLSKLEADSQELSALRESSQQNRLERRTIWASVLDNPSAPAPSNTTPLSSLPKGKGTVRTRARRLRR